MAKRAYVVRSNNVFADLGDARPVEALAKAELVRKIGAIIARRGLTQAAAALLLEVDQPKISALTRGRLAGFSLDRRPDSRMHRRACCRLAAKCSSLEAWLRVRPLYDRDGAVARTFIRGFRVSSNSALAQWLADLRMREGRLTGAESRLRRGSCGRIRGIQRGGSCAVVSYDQSRSREHGI
jgi:predicted XRE-type DNA-binding protein